MLTRLPLPCAMPHGKKKIETLYNLFLHIAISILRQKEKQNKGPKIF